MHKLAPLKLVPKLSVRACAPPLLTPLVPTQRRGRLSAQSRSRHRALLQSRKRQPPVRQPHPGWLRSPHLHSQPPPPPQPQRQPACQQPQPPPRLPPLWQQHQISRALSHLSSHLAQHLPAVPCSNKPWRVNKLVMAQAALRFCAALQTVAIHAR